MVTKKSYFFHFQGNKGTFFSFQELNFAHATVPLIHETSKIAPVLRQFQGNKSLLIGLNSLHVGSEIRKRTLTKPRSKNVSN